MPASIAENVILGDIWTEIENLSVQSEVFDRIVLIDVFEYFSYVAG